MNRTRREKIDGLIEQLDVLKSDIESLTDDEQTAYDNLPETIQTGNRGELMMSAIDNLESAVSSVLWILPNSLSGVEAILVKIWNTRG